MKRTTLTIAVGMILATSSQLSFAADNALQQELTVLKQQIESLQQRLNAVESASPKQKHSEVNTTDETLSADVAGEEQAAEVTAATSEDIDGLRADIENYKYDQSRQYERQTTKSTRDTTLYGTVQLRANAVDDTGVIGATKSTFDIGTALIGVRGNLFRDYNEGKNLDYQLSFGYGKRNDGTNNSNFNLLDAFVRYNALATNAGPETAKLNFTLGQQLLPFGLDV